MAESDQEPASDYPAGKAFNPAPPRAPAKFAIEADRSLSCWIEVFMSCSYMPDANSLSLTPCCKSPVAICAPCATTVALRLAMSCASALDPDMPREAY
jgi:hypothetical protein